MAKPISCYGKGCLTHQRAKKLSKRQNRRGGERINHYRCKICGHWHVGSSTSKRSYDKRKARAIERDRLKDLEKEGFEDA